jgi:nitrous oxidase accessory protein NosD
MKIVKIAAVALILLAVLNCAASIAVSPEMKACLGSHGSRDQYLPVITKYADEEVVQKAMGLLVIPHPYVVRADQKGSQTVYTVEGVVVEGSDGFPNGSLVTYRVFWEGNRIVSLEFVSVQDLSQVIPILFT